MSLRKLTIKELIAVYSDIIYGKKKFSSKYGSKMLHLKVHFISFSQMKEYLSKYNYMIEFL